MKFRPGGVPPTNCRDPSPRGPVPTGPAPPLPPRTLPAAPQLMRAARKRDPNSPGAGGWTDGWAGARGEATGLF